MSSEILGRRSRSLTFNELQSKANLRPHPPCRLLQEPLALLLCNARNHCRFQSGTFRAFTGAVSLKPGNATGLQVSEHAFRAFTGAVSLKPA